MIVSALLTSVGINLGLCILFFTLYSVLRKQPGNYHVYVPRLLADGKSGQRSPFNFERLIPTPGWLRRAWQPSEEDLLASSGLDAVVFMHIITFSLRVFCLAGIIGIFVILPVNCAGTQLESFDFANLTNDSLDIFSISNVNNGSIRNIDIYLQRGSLISSLRNPNHINLPFWFVVSLFPLGTVSARVLRAFSHSIMLLHIYHIW